MKLAVIVSQFNEEVTGGLLEGALAYLREEGLRESDWEIFSAPGAFELPLLAQTALKAGRFSGVVCLGCVIKGDTAHFEFISLGTTVGLMQAMLGAGCPVSFGVITTYTEEQAISRSRTTGPESVHNKGREAAAACMAVLKSQKQILAPKL